VPKILQQRDVENALSQNTIAALFTDPGSGTINTEAINDCIDRAEGEVASWLIGDININDPKFANTDRLLRQCAIDFFKVFAFERHPEYVKTFGEDPRGSSLYKRAQQRMERIQASLQKLPDQPNVKPVNSGGIITDDSVRTCITDAQGNMNGDGF
jgi:hypothetical protein